MPVNSTSAFNALVTSSVIGSRPADAPAPSKTVTGLFTQIPPKRVRSLPNIVALLLGKGFGRRISWKGIIAHRLPAKDAYESMPELVLDQKRPFQWKQRLTYQAERR